MGYPGIGGSLRQTAVAMAPGTSIIGAGHEYRRREQFGQRHDGGGPDEVVGRTRTDGREPRERFERQRNVYRREDPREQFGQRHDGGGPDKVVGRTRTDGRDP